MKMYNVVQAKKIPNKDKTVWLRIGKAFENDEGKAKLRLKLDVLPLPNEEGEVWLTLFDDRDADSEAAPSGYDAPAAPNPYAAERDGIPF